MKRFLIISLVALAIFTGATGAAPVAHATAQDTNNSNASAGNNPSASTQVADPFANAAATAAQGAAQTAAGNTPTDSTTGVGSAFAQIMTWIASLFAWLVGVAALTLDYAVYYTVVNMGAYVHNLTAIGVTWRILRDIGNIMLIFGFLAIGISIILNTERLGYGKKMLPMLLVAAVFLNFSLFFTEAIIDMGNIFATQFFTQINGGHLPTTTTTTIAGVTVNGVLTNSAGTALTTGTEGISNKLMAQLGLQTLYGNAMDPQNGTQLLSKDAPWYIGFLAILLFIVTAFVMFSLAFILITRFIYLLYLIILAPIGFAGLAVPQLAHKAQQWWSKLFEQTITAPVLLLMLYVALTVITDAQFLAGFGIAGSGNAGAATGFINNSNLPGFSSFILSFLIAMGLLIAVTITAKSLSAFGGDWATKTAGKLSFGATAWAGRATLGSAGNLLASKRMQSWARRGGLGGLALKGTVLAGKGLRSGTYDIRSAPGAAAGLGAIGINAGTGSKLTAQQVHDAQYGLKPTKEWLRESANERDKSAADLARKSTLSSGAPAAMQKELKKMSDDELAELKGIRQGQDRFIQALSPTAYGTLMKNKNLLDSEKTAIRTSWESQFSTHATSAAALGRMSDDERVALGGDLLAKPEVYENLSADDFDNIRSAKLQPGQKTTIATYVKAQHTAGIAAGAGATQLQKDLAAAAANPKFKAYYGI